MRNVYFYSKKYQAINIFSDLSKLVIFQIKNNKEYIISDKISILKKLEFDDELFKELNNSKFWSIIIDKSNTIVDNKHLAIVSKHLIDNIPYMCYLKMINLEETDASYIFNHLFL